MTKPPPSPAIPPPPADGKAPCFVVGLGSSAGGLDALTAFFHSMPPDSGMAFVVIPHLGTQEKSRLADILQHHTSLPIRLAQHGEPPQADTIHVLPPRKNLRLSGSRFFLSTPDPHLPIHHPIDLFFQSLAEDSGTQAIGIILSGTGHDGISGIRRIKLRGGLALAQTPESAAFDGMPRQAIATGVLDAILPPGEMPKRLLHYKERPHPPSHRPTPHPDDPAYESSLQEILQLVRAETGMDFSRYKRNTLCRRIDRNIHIHQRESIHAYLQFLRRSPKDVRTLSKELLIGVTQFFRDPDAFAFLRTRVLPALVQDSPPDTPLRIWVSACSTGEEAYSLAILLHDYIHAIRATREFHILATDLDPAALATADAGIYPPPISAHMEPGQLARHFSEENGSYVIHPTIRRHVTFSTHDLATPPPERDFDLITCRNILIYLESDLQREILSHFRHALAPERYLFLGTSESIGTLSTSFLAMDPKWKIFRKAPDTVPSHPAPATWDSPPHTVFEAARKRFNLNDFTAPIPPLGTPPRKENP